MPCYEFQCKRCKETFEITCALKDRELPQDCPYCGGRGARVYAPTPHRWRMPELESCGVTPAEAMAATEKAKREYGVKKP
jgi:putative FmdB family regulatory protein